jgi:hypothetical protein
MLKFCTGLRVGWVLSILGALSASGWAKTYYVDFSEGDDSRSGTTQAQAWKHAPGDASAKDKAAQAQLEPGDVVQFRAGVIYRGGIVIPASGKPGSPIAYRGTGWGEGRAILDGSELVTGWRKCQSAEEALGNPHFANLYHTEVEAESAYLMNLHETDPATKKDEFLWIAQTPNPKDPFFHDRIESFFPVERDQLTTTTITAPEAFTSPDADAYGGSSVLIWMNPNVTRRFDIESYDPAAKRITFADMGASSLYPDGRKQFFAIYNNALAIDQPGEHFISGPDASGKRRMILWPRSPENLEGRISRSVRYRGFDLGKESHIHIEGFDIRKFAGADDQGGCGIATAGRGVGSKGGYTIRDNVISHNFSGGKGYGGVYLDDTVDAVVEKNHILWNKDHRAIFVTGGEGIIIRNNRVEYPGRTAVVMYTGKNSQIIDNQISHVYATHANAITLYVASENVLVARNRVTDATNPITFQDSGPLYFINNTTDGGGVYSNVNEWPNTKRGPWSTGRIVFLNNTFTKAGNSASLSLGKDLEKEYIVINNILDGLATNKYPPDGQGMVRRHNIYTSLNNFQAERYGWKLGEGETAGADPAKLFMDPDKGDYRPKPGSPALGAGVDVKAYFPKEAFPGVDFDALVGPSGPMNIGATPTAP